MTQPNNKALQNRTNRQSVIGISANLLFFSWAFIFALNFPFRNSVLFSIFSVVITHLTSRSDEIRYFSRNAISIFTRMFLGLSVIAVSWVVVVSIENPIIKILILSISLTSIYFIRNFIPSQFSQEQEFIKKFESVNLITYFLLVFIVLIFRRWVHLIFPALLLVLLLSTSRYFDRPLFKLRRDNIRHWFVVTVVAFGSCISHFSVSPYSSRFWVSYDQVFRSAMATGLTRWGWKDANWGTGHPFRYHWLTEAVGGVLARVSGIAEEDVIGRLLPALGILFALVAVLPIAGAFPLRRKSIFFLVTVFLLLDGSFLLFSVGTMWGAAIFLFAIGFITANGTQKEWPTRLIAYSILPFMALLSQSALGLSLTLGVLSYLVILLLKRQVQFWTTITNMFLLSTTVLLVQQVFFKEPTNLKSTGASVFSQILSFPGIQITLGRSIESSDFDIGVNSLFFLLSLFAMYGIAFTFRPRNRLEIRYQIMLATQFASSLFLLNFFPLGSYAGKFLVPIPLLGLLISGIYFAIFLESLPREQLLIFLTSLSFFVFISNLIFVSIIDISDWLRNTIILCTILFIFLCLVAQILTRRRSSALNVRLIRSPRLLMVIFLCFSSLVWPHRNFLNNSWSSLRTQSGDASIVLGGPAVRDCLMYIRLNTPNDSVIATGLWRLPTAPDERYVLTSLVSQRRTLVDGPVFDHISWPSRTYFEDLKNIHTEFANTLSATSRNKLIQLGANYFLLDTRFENTDRIWTVLDDQVVLFKNDQCSVIKL